MLNMQFQYIFKNKEGEYKKILYTFEDIQNKKLDQFDGYKLMYIRQYVDYKDKNRKQIFEGDILKINNVKYTVVRLSSSFGLVNNFTGDFYEHLCNMSGMQFTEIIDNIYEI